MLKEQNCGALRITLSIRYRGLLLYFLILLLFYPMTQCKLSAPRERTFPMNAQLSTRNERSQASWDRQNILYILIC